MKYSTHYYVAAVALIITIYLLHSYQSISSSDRSIPDSQVGDLLSSLPEDKNAFPIASEDDPLFDDIKDATLTGIEVLGNSYDLKNLCSATEWNPGLWLHCHSYCGANKTSICGGLNNARNRYQTCIRLAIDAGAGLILSSTTERNEQILGLTDHHTVCPEMFWDVDSLIKKLGEPCPQLQLRMCDNRKGITHLVETPVRWYQDTPYSPGTFRQYVEEALSNKSLSLSDLSSSEQAVVNFGDSHIAWNYRAAKELSTIRKDLFKVLNFNAHLLDVSMRILQSPKLNNGSFIGVHLRAEHDWPANYGTAQQQTWHYLRTIEDIQKAGPALKTVYVSCGDSGAIQRFRDSKELQGYEVLDKSGVLKSDPVLLAELNGLNFDEKGIVEYLVLLNAQYFMGVMTSTMSNTIAYARTIQGEGDYFNDFIFPGSNRTDMWRSYPDMPYMAGNSDTRLMVFDGVDLMDGYP